MINTKRHIFIDDIVNTFVYTVICVYPCFILLKSSREALALAFLVGSFFALLNSIHFELKEINKKIER